MPFTTRARQVLTCSCRAKAVAEGALWYHLDHFVSARRAKYVYGTRCDNRYCASMQDHVARRHKAYTHVDGELYVPDAFSRIIPKVPIPIMAGAPLNL